MRHMKRLKMQWLGEPASVDKTQKYKDKSAVWTQKVKVSSKFVSYFIIIWITGCPIFLAQMVTADRAPWTAVYTHRLCLMGISVNNVPNALFCPPPFKKFSLHLNAFITFYGIESILLFPPRTLRLPESSPCKKAKPWLSSRRSATTSPGRPPPSRPWWRPWRKHQTIRSAKLGSQKIL